MRVGLAGSVLLGAVKGPSEVVSEAITPSENPSPPLHSGLQKLSQLSRRRSEGVTAYQNGDYKKAEAIFEDLFKEYPNQFLLLEWLGLAFEKDNRPGKALEVYEKALGLIETYLKGTPGSFLFRGARAEAQLFKARVLLDNQPISQKRKEGVDLLRKSVRDFDQLKWTSTALQDPYAFTSTATIPDLLEEAKNLASKHSIKL